MATPPKFHTTWLREVDASKLPSTAKLVARQLQRYYSEETGETWCPEETLMALTGKSRATVYRALAMLRAAGWIVQTRPKRQHHSPRYSLVLVDPDGVTESGPRALQERLPEVSPLRPPRGLTSETPEVSLLRPRGLTSETRVLRSTEESSDAAPPRPDGAGSGATEEDRKAEYAAAARRGAHAAKAEIERRRAARLSGPEPIGSMDLPAMIAERDRLRAALGRPSS